LAKTPQLRSFVTELPSGNVTFLFTDIEGSTELLGALGDGYTEVVGEHRRILSEIVTRFEGVVYGAFADEVSAVFRTVADAVATASLGQRSLTTATLPGGVKVRLRMGIHTGQPIAGRGEYLGLDVHRTARICAAGHGGQVLLSEVARAGFEDMSHDGVAFRDLGAYELKGLPERERIFQLLIAGVRNEFPPLRVGANSGPHPELPRRRHELVRSLQAAVTTLRTRRYAKELERDLVPPTERFRGASPRLNPFLDEPWARPHEKRRIAK
jgi:class 3 adenylate cyclase